MTDHPYEDELGAGGSGHVRLVNRDGMRIAQKLYSERVSSSSSLGAQTELKIGIRIHQFLSKFKSPKPLARIPQPYEYVEVDGHPGMTMELVDGKDLSRVLAEVGAFTLDELLSVALPVARLLDLFHSGRALGATAAGHEKPSAAHLDIKPSNIMIGLAEFDAGQALPPGAELLRALRDERAFVFLLDLGVSLAVGGEERRPVAGTKWFMAPELWEGKAATTKADVWAFGVTLYLLATNDYPFDGRESLPPRASSLSLELRNPADIYLHVSRGLGSLLQRMLQVDPDMRIEMGEIVECLNELQGTRRDSKLDHLLAEGRFQDATARLQTLEKEGKGVSGEYGDLAARLERDSERHSALLAEIQTCLDRKDPVGALKALLAALRFFSRSMELRRLHERIREDLRTELERVDDGYRKALDTSRFGEAQRLVDLSKALEEPCVVAELKEMRLSAKESSQVLQQTLDAKQKEYEENRAQAMKALQRREFGKARALFGISDRLFLDPLREAERDNSYADALSKEMLVALTREPHLLSLALKEAKERTQVHQGPATERDRLYVVQGKRSALSMSERFDAAARSSALERQGEREADTGAAPDCIVFDDIDYAERVGLWNDLERAIRAEVAKPRIQESVQVGEDAGATGPNLAQAASEYELVVKTDVFDNEPELVSQVRSLYERLTGLENSAREFRNLGEKALEERDLAVALKYLEEARSIRSDPVFDRRLPELRNLVDELSRCQRLLAHASLDLDRFAVEAPSEDVVEVLQAYDFAWVNIRSDQRLEKEKELARLLDRVTLNRCGRLPVLRNGEDWCDEVERGIAKAKETFVDPVVLSLGAEHWERAMRQDPSLRTTTFELVRRLIPRPEWGLPPQQLVGRPALCDLLVQGELARILASPSLEPDEPAVHPVMLLMEALVQGMDVESLSLLGRAEQEQLRKTLALLQPRLRTSCPATLFAVFDTLRRKGERHLRRASRLRWLRLLRENRRFVMTSCAILVAWTLTWFVVGRSVLASEVNERHDALLADLFGSGGQPLDAGLQEEARSWVAPPSDPQRLGFLLHWKLLRAELGKPRPAFRLSLGAIVATPRPDGTPGGIQAAYEADLRSVLELRRDGDCRKAEQRILKRFVEGSLALADLREEWEDARLLATAARPELTPWFVWMEDLSRLCAGDGDLAQPGVAESVRALATTYRVAALMDDYVHRNTEVSALMGKIRDVCRGRGLAFQEWPGMPRKWSSLIASVNKGN